MLLALVAYCNGWEYPSRMILNLGRAAKLRLKAHAADGRPVRLDGPPEWTCSDAALLRLDAAPDGLSAIVLGVNLGVVQIVVSGKAVVDTAIRRVSGVMDLEIVAAGAIVLDLSAELLAGPVESFDAPA